MITRSPHFNTNVLAYDLEEILILACPYCGHSNPDHRWMAPYDCLVTCECPGWTLGPEDGSMVFNGAFGTFLESDVPELEAATREAFEGA